MSRLCTHARAAAASYAGAALALLLAVAPAHAQQRVEMLLSWNAPYGRNGAQDMLTRTCDAEGGADTLYLCYRLSEDAPVFSGLTALLMLRPQFEDTLGTPWNSSEQKPPFIRVEFPSDTADTFRSGFASRGFGDWRYYFDRGEGVAKGVLRMIYAVPSVTAGQIRANRVYCMARVIFERPADRACDEGLCVEWMESKVAFSVNAVDLVADQVRSSFVSVNSPGGLACAKYRVLAERRKELEQLKREEAVRKFEEQREASQPDTTHRH